MAYQMAATAVTLNDLESHSQVAGHFNFKLNPSDIKFCAAFYTISTDSVLAVLLRYLSFLYESGDYRQENSLCYKHGKWYKIHKALFVNLRASIRLCNTYALPTKYFGSTGAP